MNDQARDGGRRTEGLGNRSVRGLPLWWVDVFATRNPVSGNRLMVFVPATDLIGDETRMRRIAVEVGFSEVTFLVPGATRGEYQARIFTPERELPYAGHPTLGSAAVWSQETAPMADRSRVVQDSAGARVAVTVVRDGRATMAELSAPPVGGVSDLALEPIAQALGLENPRMAMAGGIPPRRVETPIAQAFVSIPVHLIGALSPDPKAIRRLGVALSVNLIYVYALPDASADPILARGFVCDLGFAEDPATGSAAGSLGHLLGAVDQLDEGRTRTILQGRETGRESEIWLSRTPHEIRVAGRVRFVARGRMLPEFLA